MWWGNKDCTGKKAMGIEVQREKEEWKDKEEVVWHCQGTSKGEGKVRGGSALVNYWWLNVHVLLISTWTCIPTVTLMHGLTRNAIPSSVPASHGSISMSMSPAHVQFGRQRFNALTPENTIIIILTSFLHKILKYKTLFGSVYRQQWVNKNTNKTSRRIKRPCIYKLYNYS